VLSGDKGDTFDELVPQGGSQESKVKMKTV